MFIFSATKTYLVKINFLLALEYNLKRYFRAIK